MHFYRPILILPTRMGTQAWVIWATCMGSPLPQMDVLRYLSSEAGAIASTLFQNLVVMLWLSEIFDHAVQFAVLDIAEFERSLYHGGKKKEARVYPLVELGINPYTQFLMSDISSLLNG